MTWETEKKIDEETVKWIEDMMGVGVEWSGVEWSEVK